MSDLRFPILDLSESCLCMFMYTDRTYNSCLSPPHRQGLEKKIKDKQDNRYSYKDNVKSSEHYCVCR